MTNPSGPIAILCGYDTNGILQPCTIDADGALVTSGATVDAQDVTYTPAVLADWDSSTDPGNQDGANDQLAERVKDIEDVISYTPYPKRHNVFSRELTIVTGNALAHTLDANQEFGQYSYQSTAADGDEFTFSCVLEAGTYDIYILCVKDSNRGKIDLYHKHSSAGSYTSFATGVDQYNAAQQYNQVLTANFTLSLSGRYTIKATVNGKHASSSDYYFVHTLIWIKPSAD